MTNPNQSQQKAQKSDDVEANEVAFRNKPFADTKSQQNKPEPVAKGASNAMDEKERSFIRDKTTDIDTSIVGGEQSPSLCKICKLEREYLWTDGICSSCHITLSQYSLKLVCKVLREIKL